MPAKKKLFIGRKLKEIRVETTLTQAKFAKSLGISTSYLNLMENNQRHVTAPVLMALASKYSIDVTSLSDNDTDRILADLQEVFADSEFDNARPSKQELSRIALNTPDFAKAFLNIHQAYQHTQKLVAELDDAVLRGSTNQTPYEEVRDFFHYQNNYIHELDVAGETLSETVGKLDGTALDRLAEYLRSEHGVKVTFDSSQHAWDHLRVYDQAAKNLTLNAQSSIESQSFQIAHQIALLEQKSVIDRIAKQASFSSPSAEEICKIGLANYCAGSIILPYSIFLEAAKSYRHDLELLGDHFHVSMEQVAHRLSTLQRPDQRGLPFFFARVDQAGNITKRHSATKLQFARFGSACPLWNVHAAFETPTKIIKQMAETPDGERYICIASAKSKRMGGYKSPVIRYALALGCEIEYADQIVYCDDMNTTSENDFEKIGISCRICTRKNCLQRSLPPLKRELRIDHSERSIVPFKFD